MKKEEGRLQASVTLRHRLPSGPTLVMPDAYDPPGAMLIARAGFEAVRCSGYSMAAASGYPVASRSSPMVSRQQVRQPLRVVGPFHPIASVYGA